MSEDVISGLPSALASVLRDQSVVVPQDAAVFELIASWAKAPALTASATATASPETRVVEVIYRQTNAARATTGAGC